MKAFLSFVSENTTMSSLMEMMITMPIMALFSYISLKQTKVFAEALKKVKQLPVENQLPTLPATKTDVERNDDFERFIDSKFEIARLDPR